MMTIRLLSDPEAMVLVAECEAFLDGRYAELVEGAGAPVPPWAWMNRLAHGTEDELRGEVDRLGDLHGWRQTSAYVAAEMLDEVDAGHLTLAALQRDVLVPLELDVIECGVASGWTPGQMASALLRLLAGEARRRRS